MATLQPGEILDDRYRIDTVIARGGMSTVYRCIDMRLGRTVAAKVLRDEFSRNPEITGRFKREARSMAQLNHPNLVNVYDTGSQGETVFLIMELIDGGTLRELLNERGPMPPHAAVSVMKSVLTGLNVAHEAGLVHRDIKPDNILVTTDGRVKLADFGLVRAADAAAESDGKIHGTVKYLSPEQVTGEPVGPEADVYQAGLVFFEMLTGETPFHGDTDLDVAEDRLHHSVPAPSSRIEGVPAAIDQLVKIACDRDRYSRFENAADFLTTLQRTAKTLELPGFTVPAPKKAAAARAASTPPGDPTAVMTTAAPLTPPPGMLLDDDGADCPTEIIAPGRTDDEPGRVYDRPAHDPDETSVIGLADIGADDSDVPDDTAQKQLPAEPQQAARIPENIPPPTRQINNRSGAKLWLWLVVVAVMVAAIALGGWWLGSGRYGEVPQVIGMSQAQATEVVRDAGYDAAVNEVWDNQHPEGDVLGTAPAGGERLPHGHAVAVMVSKGQPTVPEPPAGRNLEDYAQVLADYSLNWTNGEAIFSREIPAGDVVSVDPEPGTLVAAGSKITVHLSKGPRPELVPMIRGMSEQDAVERLKQATFTVAAVREEFNPDIPGGSVITTEPGPGVTAPAGSDVTLVVSNAIAMPELVGLSQQQAEDELRDLGITVDRVMVSTTSGSVEHEVLDSTPQPGQALDPHNKKVMLMVTDEQRVPSVTGMTVAEAKEELEKAQLFWEIETAAGDEDTVTKQKPSAGALAHAAEKVTLTTTKTTTTKRD
ncbi:PASTA domain-containing protein [Corynebacterium mendelii]|uniref:non-specific serine/threonine protein kinase n=1 Tax=Corynebacterium mendelii TaxID=2765362 RepID=A0A939IW67_9CORY|nr:PASTA domain-containing protein [Corynebacterium mendelii]MBN9643085.1 PASTA domain-containing protein [Corynebacterium mendelii]